jgi:exosortase/archaeosortase family protein
VRFLSRPVVVRPPLIVEVLALGAWSAARHAWIQGIEAVASSVLLRAAFGRATFALPSRALLFVRFGPLHWASLHVALSCSVALLLPALCLVTAVLIALRPVAAYAPLLALPVATMVFGICNLIRITLIALVGSRLGTGRVFDVVHAWAGTAVTVVGVAAAVATYLFVLGVGRQRTAGRVR